MEDGRRVDGARSLLLQPLIYGSEHCMEGENSKEVGINMNKQLNGSHSYSHCLYGDSDRPKRERPCRSIIIGLMIIFFVSAFCVHVQESTTFTTNYIAYATVPSALHPRL